MIDLHSHILPGLDDGASSVEETLALARALADDGVSVVAGTPHVRWDHPVTPSRMTEALAIARAAVEREQIPIEILPGGEVALEMLDALDAPALAAYALAGNPSFLLVEFPYVGWPPDLATQLTRLLDEGITPVLAHPERNPEVQAAPLRLAPLVGEGVLVQVTAGSVVGAVGRSAARAAQALLDGHLVHLLASDAHRPSARVSLSAARNALREPELAAWLTVGVPASIARRGVQIPPRPPTRRRRRFPSLR
jgi:protein-tyrosine phosphatase